MANSNPVIQRSRIRIIIALCIIALISTASMITMSVLLKDQEYDASLINQAGRQRMLSQRIALGVHTFIAQLKNEDRVHENTRSLIRESANLMLNSHRGLTSLTDSEEIEALYFNGEPSLDEEIINYTKSALDILSVQNIDQLKDKQLGHFDIESLNYLLFRLNIIVSAYEREAKEHLDKSFKSGLFIWIIGLLILVFSLFIYLQSHAKTDSPNHVQ